MSDQDDITRCLAVVDQVLRTTFPDNFDQRCMYAAFGIRDLLRLRGISAEIVGGDVLCFVLSQDARQSTLQGFGNASSELPSHFWLESDGVLLDLGPHYLPRGSSYPALAMPVVRWPLKAELPLFLRYRRRIRYHADVQLQQPDPAITRRMNTFLARCFEHDRSGQPVKTDWTWELTGMPAVRQAAQRGDRWARGAFLFLERATRAELPF